MASDFAVSIVIPTHNRKTLLLETLSRLNGQAFAEDFEVIVVLDRDTGGSAAAVRAGTWDFPLRLLESDAGRAAFARNVGAAEARGRRLVFLDDDISVGPRFVAAHHRGAAGDEVIIGPPFPAFEGESRVNSLAKSWWNDELYRIAEQSDRSSFMRFITGNCSINKDTFEELGGFDGTLVGNEDYEFGYRVLKSGRGIAYAEDAAGAHFGGTDLQRSMRRAEESGRANAQILRKHPELFPYFPIVDLYGGQNSWRMRQMAFRFPWIGRAVYRARIALLPVLAAVGANYRWSLVSDAALVNRYCQGVAAELGSFDALVEIASRWESGNRPGKMLVLDVLDGWPEMEARVRREAPDAVALYCAGQPVATQRTHPWSLPVTVEEFRAFLKQHAGHWDGFVKAAARLTLPPEEDIVPAGAPRWRLEGTYDIGEIDITGGTVRPAMAELSFPARLLVRDGAVPVSWLWLWEPPAADDPAKDLRNQLLNDWRVRDHLLSRLDAAQRKAPAAEGISVIVTARGAGDDLDRCLQSLLAQAHETYEIIVTGAGPGDGPEDARIRYLGRDADAPEHDLDHAVRQAQYDLIALTTDRCMADGAWLSSMSAAFRQKEVAAVTGYVAPRALDTRARVYFEDMDGGMGRGFVPLWWRGKQLSGADRLWASECGVGANMAFRRTALAALGAVGPVPADHVPVGRGHDAGMIHRLLSTGGTVVYEPSAIVWHAHAPDFAALRRHRHDIGVAHAAYVRRCLKDGTVTRGQAVRYGVFEWGLQQLVRRLVRPHGHSRGLVRAELSGAMKGWLRRDDRPGLADERSAS